MTEQRRDDHGIDAAVDAAWRQAASEQPPAGVDATILAAARAAVRRDAKEHLPATPPRLWASWQPLAAAAGVMGLSFLLVQLLPRDDLTHPPAKQDAARAPVGDSATITSPPAASTGAMHPSQAEEPASTPAAPPATAVRPPVQRPAAPAKAFATDEAAVIPGTREATSGAAPPAAMEATASQSVAARPESPTVWASRIAVLHDAGELAAAAAELRAFRAAQPDADDYLPEAVRAWAASVGQDGAP